MPHWADPAARGAYHQPWALPPTPQPRGANDLSARMARLEEHYAFAHWDRYRMEQDSRQRAQDLARALVTMDERLDAFERSQATERAVERSRRRSIRTWLQWGLVSVKYALAGGLFVLMLLGKASVEQVKLWLGVLGLPTG